MAKKTSVKKRILQFIPSFHQGGSESQAVALTRMLKDDGTYDVCAATLNKEGSLRAEFDKIGLPDIPEFPLISFYNANFVTQARRCARYLRENKIDLVHTHDFYTNVFGMAAATLAGTRIRIASKRETHRVRSKAQDFIEKIAFGRADAVVVNSNAVRDYLKKQGIPAQKIEIIYNGIDLERFAAPHHDKTASRQRFGLPEGDDIKFITMVANLRHTVKNLPMLLRVAKRVIETHPDTHFVIAGEGELESELKQTANDLGVAKNVHFIGRCTDVPALLSLSTACVLTSTAEGFSNSILEYMAAALPVVATNVGGASEAIIEAETGHLVAPDDDGEMSRKLVKFLDDEEKAKGIGRQGRHCVETRFSAATQFVNTKNLYENMLNKVK